MGIVALVGIVGVSAEAAGEVPKMFAAALSFAKPSVVPVPEKLSYKDDAEVRLDAAQTMRARCPDADATLEAKASERLVSVARALETNGWRVPCDGSFKGQNRGKLNGTSMPFWCVTRFCYMLKSLHLLTGDAHWGDLYSAVKTERLHEIEAGGAIDEKILKACYGNCVWIYLSSAQALALLIKMEENPSDREQMKRGLSAYADRVAYLMKDRVKYENTVERPFRYANGRNG